MEKNIGSANSAGQWLELAAILRTEWQGAAIDRQRAHHLAGGLLPLHPELKNTLAHIQGRMAPPPH